jgi:MFS family permease
VKPTLKGGIERVERRAKDPSLRASIRDGQCHALMLGGGETYLGPFGIFLGAGTLQIGLLATVPALFGAIMQWVGVFLMGRFKSRRRMIVTGVVCQALVWIPLALLPFVFGATGQAAVFALILLAMAYQATGGLVTPVWNSLIGDLVKDDMRGRFFGRRNRITGINTFLALLVAGGILEVSKRFDAAVFGFLTIFLASTLARLGSAYWLSRYSDPRPKLPQVPGADSWRGFLAARGRTGFMRFSLFAATINLAVAFSGPYFSLYMLRELRFSYLQFTLVTAASAISQFLTFRYWGELSDRFGNKKILNLCGYGIATVPVVWLFSATPAYLIVIQLWGGFVWAGYSLASANYMFDAIEPEHRARAAAFQGLLNGVFVFVGSLAGGLVASRLPARLVIGSWVWQPVSVLLFIFGISGLLRLVAAATLLRRFREVRQVESIGHRELLFRISHIRPIAGATFSVITGLLGDKEADHPEDPDAVGTSRSRSPD